jgi:hypothetical protein
MPAPTTHLLCSCHGALQLIVWWAAQIAESR